MDAREIVHWIAKAFELTEQQLDGVLEFIYDAGWPPQAFHNVVKWWSGLQLASSTPPATSTTILDALRDAIDEFLLAVDDDFLDTTSIEARFDGRGKIRFVIPDDNESLLSKHASHPLVAAILARRAQPDGDGTKTADCNAGG